MLSPAWPEGALSNGILTYVGQMVRGLSELGVGVSILTSRTEGPRDSRVVRLPIEAAPPWLRAVGRIAPDLRQFRSGADAILGALASVHPRPQLIEMEESFGWAGRVRRHGDVPVVVRLHGPWFLVGAATRQSRDAGFCRRVRREGKAIQVADAVISPSTFVLQQVRDYYRLPLPRARVIPNPVSIPKHSWKAERAQPARILFVGRLDHLKGADLIVDALRDVLEAEPTAELVMIGPSSPWQDAAGEFWTIDRYIERHASPTVAARIRLLGQRTGQALENERLGAAITVVSSRYETFPYAVIEAMAFGCPLVAPSVGGVPELISHNRNGLLFRSGDPRDLTDQMLSLLGDSARASRLGSQARVDTQMRFDPRTLARQALEVYGTVAR